MRGVMQAAMIPALKSACPFRNDASWKTVRPPLIETAEKEGQVITAKLDGLGFTMPGLKQAMAVAAESMSAAGTMTIRPLGWR